MKSPEDIKLGLECCINWGTGCTECQYDNLPNDECVVAMKSDALAYILRLEREKNAAQAELVQIKLKHGDEEGIVSAAYLFQKAEQEARAFMRKQFEAATPKWISVEERLPEICDLVLVIANGKPKENIELINAVLIASHWGDEGWIADGYDGWDKLKVSHWMPLPEPPKEETNEKSEAEA